MGLSCGGRVGGGQRVEPGQAGSGGGLRDHPHHHAGQVRSAQAPLQILYLSLCVCVQAHQYSEHVAGAGCDVIAFMADNVQNGFAARLGHAGACEAVVRSGLPALTAPSSDSSVSVCLSVCVSVLQKHRERASVAARACTAGETRRLMNIPERDDI